MGEVGKSLLGGHGLFWEWLLLHWSGVVVSEIRLDYPSWAIETTTLNLSVGEGWDRFLDDAAGGFGEGVGGVRPRLPSGERVQAAAQGYQAVSSPR